MDLSRFSGWLSLYRAPSTRAGYVYDLHSFCVWAEGAGVQSPGDITYNLCLAYLAHKKESGSGANHLRRIVWALRCWLAFELGPDHPARDLAPPRAPRRHQRSLTAPQLAHVLASCDTSMPVGVRDLAIMALLADSGLRSAELCRLTLEDVDLDGLRLVVQIKGGDDGAGVFSELTASYIRRWLEVRAKVARCRNLFVSVYHGKPLTPSGLKVTLRRIGQRAGLAALSPHDFRRTFAMLATEAGAPTRVTQVGGRWSSVAMVETYTQNLAADSFRRYSPVEYALRP